MYTCTCVWSCVLTSIFVHCQDSFREKKQFKFGFYILLTKQQSHKDVLVQYNIVSSLKIRVYLFLSCLRSPNIYFFPFQKHWKSLLPPSRGDASSTTVVIGVVICHQRRQTGLCMYNGCLQLNLIEWLALDDI